MMNFHNIRPLELWQIGLTDEYQLNAARKTEDYLLSLETGRLLAGFYENAGMKTPFVRYGGWENMMIGGHTLGHYLSAVSQAFESSFSDHDLERRNRLDLCIDAIVDGLAECQEKMGSGLVWGAIPVKEGGIEAQFDNVEKGKTNIIKEAWVPWYTLHKILNGLLDAYEHAHNDSALIVAERLGDWVLSRVKRWDEQTKRNVLAVEYGGMNDALYRLSVLSGEERFLEAAHAFDEEALFDAILSETKDVLRDKHANTTIPKVLGALNRYFVCEEERYLRVAEVFFRIVTEKHTYVTGGNSEWEHFGRDNILDAERTNCNCETCNVYNMLKLARGLFLATGDAVYLDYYDNAFTNAILSSQNPETGMTTYFQPMAGGFFKVFSRPYDKFWCCTGSGMENFTKLGDGIYYRSDEGMIVARYVSSRVKSEEGEVEITCNFPLEERAKIRVLNAEKPLTLFLRVPDWCAGVPVLTNGGDPVGTREGAFLRVEVANGDELELTLPVTVTLSGLPDSKDVFAFKYGGAVLSADLGTEDMEETETGVEVCVPKRRILPTERIYFENVENVMKEPSAYLVREGDQFVLRGGDVCLRFGLHYKRYRERYAIYFHLLEGERKPEADMREPIDVVQSGYGQYETDALHAMAEEHSVGVTSDGTYRYAEAGGYFAYDFRIEPTLRNSIAITLRKSDNGKPIKISVGGEVIYEEFLFNMMGEDEYTREFVIPPEIVSRHARTKTVLGENVTVITVRFEGIEGKPSAKICGFIRLFAE